jgi:hypothetical protein
MQRLLMVIVILSAIAFGPAYGQAPVDSTAPVDGAPAAADEINVPVDEQLAAEIGTLIAQLGSPHHSEREAATTRLIDIGLAAFAQLSAAYRASDELEVQLRIERIVYDAYLDHHLFERNGFLGIVQSPVPIGHEDDRRIRRGHVGIQVQRVIDNTAAQEANLREQDVIIALDGEPIPAAGLEVVAAFGESIRLRKPGARVVLTVLRGRRQFDVDVTLGARPRIYYNSGQRVVYELLVETRQRFQEFWERHFQLPVAE